ncbi:MAG: hypothetical protein GY885_06070 [Phycisphaeraceae bacterium]|nr:hypothetical protein [Phycisphaeraceae bacterium]
MPDIIPDPGPGARRRTANNTGRRGVNDLSGSVVDRGTTRADDPARDGVRLAVIAFTTFAAGLGMLVLGWMAERAGIEAWLGMGEFERPIGGTVVTGARMPGTMIQSLYEAGVVEPLFFAAAMALLIPPIAGIVAARPLRPGVAAPAAAARIAAGIAAGLVVAADVAIVAVTMSTVRPTIDDVVIGEDAWLDAIRNVAAADTVAAILAILLAVLVFRMPLDRWARGLVGAIAITAAVLATGTAAGSAGTLDFLQSERPVVVPRGWTGGTSLDLGRTPGGGMATIDRSLDAKPVVSRRISPVERITVPGTMSIAELVAAPIPD